MARGEPNLLRGEELIAVDEQNLFDAIRRLRPTWLRPRGVSSPSGPVEVTVVLGAISVGGVDYLRGLRVESVREVSYLSPAEATTLWGTGFTGGAIRVLMKP